MTRQLKYAMLFLLSLTFTCSIGCSSGNNPEAAIASVNEMNIQRLANLYAMYQVHHSFQGPADEAEFKQYLKTVDESILKPMGVESNAIDDIFVCERDGQPFVIRYEVSSGPRGSQEPVVFEQVGSEGMRMVAFLNMVQREVDDAEYNRLLDREMPDRAGNRNDGRGDSRSGG